MTLPAYSGYENYPTWNVALWLNNEHGDYLYWTERAEELQDECEDRDDLIDTLAAELKEQITEANPLGDGASLFTDIMTWAMEHVNWHEVAESFIED